jgi:hypothetical protein
MLDVTLDLPLDLKRICQPNAKVYFPKRKEFGVVTRFDDEVHIKLDQGKQSKTETFQRQEFIDMLQSDGVVAKSRVVIPDGDNGSMKIKPRVVPKEASSGLLITDDKTPVNHTPITKSAIEAMHAPQPAPVAEPLLKGYICEKTGKFSTKPAAGLVEIEYRKVTKKVELMLDSVQLQKLKELGII